MVLLVIGATGCTVEAGGVVGLTATPDSAPVAVLAVCEGYIDGLTLYDVDAGDDAPTSGSWRHQGRLAGQVSLDLERPGPEWVTEQVLQPLLPGKRYRLYGWTEKNRWSADGPHITAEDLQALRPGLVTYEALTADGESRTSTQAEDRFRQDRC